jgi:hypothetical protein
MVVLDVRMIWIGADIQPIQRMIDDGGNQKKDARICRNLSDFVEFMQPINHSSSSESHNLINNL